MVNFAFVALYARVLVALAVVCPCPASDAGCPGVHARTAGAVALVALADRDPDDAAARLVGAACHETEARTEVQRGGGPAVSAFQLEVRGRDAAETRALRAVYLADPVLSAGRALSIARACGGSMESYAHGSCRGGTHLQRGRAAALRRSVWRARVALARATAPAPASRGR